MFCVWCLLQQKCRAPVNTTFEDSRQRSLRDPWSCSFSSLTLEDEVGRSTHLTSDISGSFWNDNFLNQVAEMILWVSSERPTLWLPPQERCEAPSFLEIISSPCGWKSELVKGKRGFHIWMNLWRAFYIKVTAFLFPLKTKLDQKRWATGIFSYKGVRCDTRLQSLGIRGPGLRHGASVDTVSTPRPIRF